MHSHHLISCDNERQVCAWLRAYTVAVSAAVTSRWILGWLPGFIVFVANVRARIVYGRTAILRPSRTGGVDHGLAAMIRGRNPMIFGGDSHRFAECSTLKPRMRVAVVHVMLSATDWIAVRRWRVVKQDSRNLCHGFVGGQRA